MSGPVKKGWCPTALRPMQSGDGWLARIASPEQGLSPEQVFALASLSRTFGNGQIDITPRLNWQLRGLCEDRHGEFVEAAREAGLVTPRDAWPVPVIVSPFCETSTINIVAQLTETLASLSSAVRFPGKFCCVVSQAGPFSLETLHADLRIDQIGQEWRLALAGAADAAEPVLLGKTQDVAQAASALLHAAAAMALDERPEGSILLSRWLTLADVTPIPAPAWPTQNSIDPPVDFALLEPPFGRCTADHVLAIAQSMPAFARLAIAPGRSLVVRGVIDARLAKRLGWIVSRHDPRRMMSVCTGAPACAHGFAETLSLAEAIASRVASKGQQMHVSGCTKGCARRERASVAITAVQGGFYMQANATAQEALGGRFFASNAALLEAIAA